MKYFDEIKRSMDWLGSQEKSIFLGQAVGNAGTFMYGTLEGVPAEKRIEMPVTEQLQMQMTIGLSLAGFVPVSVYPRQNFLLLGVSDMSGVLDKLPALSDGKVSPNVIIRVAAGTTKPIHPGHQHVGNYAEAFRHLFDTIEVIELKEPEDIFPAYQKAYSAGHPTLMIEFGDYYGEK